MLASTSATAPLAGLYLLTVAGWIVVEARQARHQRAEATSADAGSRRVLRACYAVAIVGAMVIGSADRHALIGPATVVSGIGIAVLWCGIGLRVWCFRTLGHYFTFEVQTSGDQPVVTAGPYRLLRHPSYAAILVAVIGIGLFYRNLASLVFVVAVVTGGLVYRILVEERALLERLGDPYRAFAATRKRLVPFIW